MGVRNMFWEKYGGAKLFFEKLWGPKNFPVFFGNSSDRVPSIIKDQPLTEKRRVNDFQKRCTRFRISGISRNPAGFLRISGISGISWDFWGFLGFLGFLGISWNFLGFHFWDF